MRAFSFPAAGIVARAEAREVSGERDRLGGEGGARRIGRPRDGRDRASARGRSDGTRGAGRAGRARGCGDAS